MIDYSALKAIFGNTLPEAHIFFATRAANAIVPGYVTLRKEFGLSPAHTNRKVWKMFVAEYNKETAPVPVTGVSLKVKSATLSAGDTFQLEWDITPANADTKYVSFVTSTPAITAVNATGLITIGAGIVEGSTYTVMVKTDDGSFTDTFTVTGGAAA